MYFFSLDKALLFREIRESGGLEDYYDLFYSNLLEDAGDFDEDAYLERLNRLG